MSNTEDFHGISFFRKLDFEALLEKYQAEVDTFKEKEVHRQLEEIIATLSQMDELAASLEAAKGEAMVS